MKKTKNIVDLGLLYLLIVSDILVEYDFQAHVAPVIALGQQILPPSATQTQTYNEGIETWTQENLAKLNSDKSRYISYTRIEDDFTIRFTLDNHFSEQQSAIKVLGVWIGEDPNCWEINTQVIMKRAYASMSAFQG